MKPPAGRRKTRPLEWSTEHSKSVLWNTGGMYRVELYADVRRSVYVEGLSARAAARRFGLARETVRKMLRDRLPPGIGGTSRSGVRSWTPSPGSSIRSSATISTVRRSNGTRPRASASAYARSTPSRAATRSSKLRARADAGPARDVRATGASAGRRPGRLRRSAGGHRRRRTQGA